MAKAQPTRESGREKMTAAVQALGSSTMRRRIFVSWGSSMWYTPPPPKESPGPRWRKNPGTPPSTFRRASCGNRAAIQVLNGDLSGENRVSRWMRNMEPPILRVSAT